MVANEVIYIKTIYFKVVFKINLEHGKRYTIMDLLRRVESGIRRYPRESLDVSRNF